MLSKKEQKLIKSLKIKKYRTREKRFLVEGTKNVLELLDSHFEIDLIIGTKTFSETYEGEIEPHRFETVSPGLLTQLGFLKTNDSVLAVAKMKPMRLSDAGLKDSIFVLDGVSDPGNLGTIIRTLDWFGFDKLICSLDSADFYNPKTIASTMGSFTRVKVFYEELPVFLQKNSSFPIYITEMHGEAINTVEIAHPCIMVMGSESHGVSQEVASQADKSISIPRIGDEAESLNVGVATGIIASYLRILK